MEYEITGEDLQAFLVGSLSDSECKQIADLLANISPEALPQPGFGRASARLRLEAIDAWKNDMRNVFLADAEKVLARGDADRKLEEWNSKVQLLAKFHRKAEVAQYHIGYRTRKNEEQIEVHQEKVLKENERPGKFIGRLSDDAERTKEEGEYRKLTMLRKRAHQIQVLYDFKAELLKEVKYSYESTGRLPNTAERRVREQGPTPRMIERVCIAYQLLSNPQEILLGRQELNAALLLKEGRESGDLVKELDKAIKYKRAEGGNRGRLRLAIEFLQRYAPEYLEEKET